MQIRQTLKRLVVAIVAIATMTGGIVATGEPAIAAGTTCKTIYLNGDVITSIRPHMAVPVCYNGSSIWQNGGVTPGVDTFGYVLNDISWYGTYNGGGSWLGAGENYRVTVWGGWWGFSCASRWTINAWGGVTSFNRGC